jgi:diguanylate cyclase (GGDEF)-like protein
MRRKILLIDDDRLQFRLTQAHFNAFQGEHYELDWAATYEEGLAKLLSGAHAACLLDYQLGERDGLQLIREAMAAGCRTPIVFLTAETGERVDIEAMNAGALDYLVKGEINPRMVERSLRYALKLGETLEALRRLATRDQLTGLLNRREFDRILEEERERALRFGHTLALIMVDIDHFKAVNDAHGHPVGDVVLREVARHLGAQVRTVDRVARFGGEEFGIILMHTDRAAAMEVAVRVCSTIARAPIQAGASLALKITVSAGVAVLPGDAANEVELVSAADKALYAAKAGGRNRAVNYRQL